MSDYTNRTAKPMMDGEILTLGRHTVEWIDAPHMPHGWNCGLLSETGTQTLFCGDLFTQSGDQHHPLAEKNILGPSEQTRKLLDHFAHAPGTQVIIERLAATAPRTLACMHGAYWFGDGAALLRALGHELIKSQTPKHV